MELTRKVVLDLMPLYLANEVSPETRALIEEYLKTDPELARTARQSAAVKLPNDVPVALTQDDELRAYKKAKLSLIWRTVILASVMSIILVALLVLMFFFRSSASEPSPSTISHHAPDSSILLAASSTAVQWKGSLEVCARGRRPTAKSHL
jgi:hypothetical protein